MTAPVTAARDESSLSYVKGPDAPGLLEDTIGANLERTASRFPDNDALVEFATGKRWTYA